jgi:hypothetical protein
MLDNLELPENKPPHCLDLPYFRADYPSACAHVRPHRYRQAPHHRLALRLGTRALSDRSNIVRRAYKFLRLNSGIRPLLLASSG